MNNELGKITFIYMIHDVGQNENKTILLRLFSPSINYSKLRYFRTVALRLYSLHLQTN